MSVKVREYNKRGKSGWEVDIMFKWPDGELYRERVKAPVGSKSGAKSWGEQRQAELIARGRKAMDVEKKKEVPTLKEFAPRFIDGDARANRQKPSTITSKESLLRLYLLPRFGERRLDEAIQELAGHESLTTTQRYMHLTPAAKDAAISLLDTAGPQLSGDMLETGSATQGKAGG